MLEILFMIWFVKLLAGKARAKHRAGWWGALGVLGWVGGELTAAIILAPTTADMMTLYLAMLMGAAIGALLAFVAVAVLPVRPPPDFPAARVV